MQLSIQHTTQYIYSDPLNYSIQQLKLTPHDGFGQRVKNWSISVNGQLSQHQDTYGNIVHTMVLDGNHSEIKLVAKGEVETGLPIKANEERLPLPIFLRNTALQLSRKSLMLRVPLGFIPPHHKPSPQERAYAKTMRISLLHVVAAWEHPQDMSVVIYLLMMAIC
jgi:transglutaminase-like putative cysteine protease